MERQDLTGKVAIITGASSGIGAAAARALAARGVFVALAARSAGALAALEQEIGPERVLALPTDITKGPEVGRLVEETVHRFGRVDVLFANAGRYIKGTIAEGDPDAWAELLDANINGVLRPIRAALPHMIAQHAGDIVVTASISGHTDIDGEAVYSASKHAVIALVNILRREVAPYGVRVAAISPGIVLNGMWGVTDPAEVERAVGRREGLRSEDVADLVVEMLTVPARITLRDIVAIAQGQVI